jgi:hypothetical protein
VANVKISALPAISSLTGTETFPVVQSGTTSRITSANLQAYLATDTYVRNHANAAFIQANTPSYVANSAASYANAAFTAANTASATNLTQNNSITAAFNTANAAFTAANNTISKNTSSWTVATGTNTYSITVPDSGTYQIWIRGNIPNGIIAYLATVVVTNTNVPVVGAQYAWVYNGGGTPLDFTSIPNQFVGTANTIIRSSTSPSATTNRFDFGINNSSGSSQTVQWGYVALS